jgi:hypothetical protein
VNGKSYGYSCFSRLRSSQCNSHLAGVHPNYETLAVSPDLLSRWYRGRLAAWPGIRREGKGRRMGQKKRRHAGGTAEMFLKSQSSAFGLIDWFILFM